MEGECIDNCYAQDHWDEEVPQKSPIAATLQCSWMGTWDTNWGDMKLQQSGDVVTGSYTWDEGHIQGTVSGNKLIGTWSEDPSYSPPDDAGDVELTISDDCNSFGGKWRYGSSGEWGDWTGKRISPSYVGAQPTCPIGGGAPLLRDPGIPSGSLCRGACGPNCTTCTDLPNITISIPDATGNLYYNCTYEGVVSCPTHRCCREHDDCFDKAVATYGETNESGPHHMICNRNCIEDEEGSKWNCLRWAFGGGPHDPDDLIFSDSPNTTGPFPGPCPTE